MDLFGERAYTERKELVLAAIAKDRQALTSGSRRSKQQATSKDAFLTYGKLAFNTWFKLRPVLFVLSSLAKGFGKRRTLMLALGSLAAIKLLDAAA
ncbi:MAG: hypothetical protein ACFB21_13865 [Opitutales bacterium]